MFEVWEVKALGRLCKGVEGWSPYRHEREKRCNW